MECGRFSAAFFALLLAVFAPAVSAQNVFINEIMFHPSSENSREEYLELYNAGPTNVNLSGWKFTRGIQFTFPSNTFIKTSGYLVLAGQRAAFTNKYPGVTNVLGDFVITRITNVVTGIYTNFENSLSNGRDRLTLEDAVGNTIDDLTYADEGDWAIRQRGLNDGGYQGWTWLSRADGLGRSLELVNPNLPNERGQNWAASTVVNGTPGVGNSVTSFDAPALVVDVGHAPLIPQSTNTVVISARVIDESPVSAVRLFWRVNNGAPPAFTSATMFDDGAHSDGASGDGLWAASIPPQANLAVVEFYVEAVDDSNQTNTWPRPAVNTDGVTVMDRNSFSVNALYQVDNTAYTGVAPLHKIILTPAEVTELGNLFNGSPQSDAAFNLTFISVDAQGVEVRYLCTARNRGNGSRSGNPHNYRIGFVSDAPFHNKGAINMNARNPWAQHFGSVLALQSGAVGSDSFAAQLRVNGGAGPGGTPANNHYAANEDIGGDWAENHFPNDSGGNAYKVQRNINPPNFDYRGTTPSAYQNTYFKESNASENDWSDMIAMLEVMGENQTGLFTSARARAAVNVEQWLLHLAVMNLMGNNETGLNSGYNDDYFMYRGVNDPRYLLLYHDLDSVLSQSSMANSVGIFTATQVPGAGSGTAFNNFMRFPEFELIYHLTLQRLLNTTFAKTNFDALITQTLGSYMPVGTINTMKTWMDGRRTTVQGILNAYFATNPAPPTATVAGTPRSPTPFTTATLTVGGSNVVSYRFKLNNGAYGAETPVATPISLVGLANGSTNVVSVMGKSAAGAWQHGTNSPTVSPVWVVNTSVPSVRLNEVLAQNTAALNHVGTFPDVIELFNEGGSPVNLGGLRLTDDPLIPNKFTFPTNTTIAAGGYLHVFANNEDGSGGLHTGFSLSATGEGVYLFATNGALLDSVVFGLQLADLSVGRFGSSGEWTLCTPTFPGANSAVATGSRNALRINEWLTAGTPPFAEDFVELYNPLALPVDFGGCFFTDELIGWPTRHAVPPLTFIQSNSFVAMIADENTGAGADHLNFALSSDLGEIALFDLSLAVIDSVSYGPQTPNVSQGRCGNGANNFVFLAAPSPGAGNLCPAGGGGSGTISVLAYNATWRFNQTSNLDGVAWNVAGYDDTTWQSGPGPFGSASGITEPVQTFLTVQNGRITFYFRSQFVFPASLAGSTLLLSHFTDDGLVLYVNGQEAYRYNLPAGPMSYTNLATFVSGPPPELTSIPLPMTNVFTGTNLITVEVHQGSAGSGDVYFGAKLEVVTNSVSAASIRLNEVLANNSNVEEPDGSTPDWVEFYNPSAGAVDLGDSSLSDDVAVPRRWVFPAGSVVPAGGYHRVFFSASAPVSATNTGFGLKDTGDALYLFSPSGALLDTVTFGLQAVDFSIGRAPGGTNWTLTVPTPGATNLAQNLGDISLVKINEWMANPTAGEDWFELFNGNPVPVALADHWLSDNLSTPALRMLYLIPKLSFIGIGAYAYRTFDADNAPQNGANHVNFKLSNGGDAIGLSLPGGTVLDAVIFGAQTVGVSQGRLPDGAANIVSFPTSVSQGDLNWLPLNNVVISEVLTHTDPPLEDAIEIQNTNGASVSVAGWYLSDSKNDLRRYQITNALTIPAGGFRVFYETQFNDTSVPTSAFSLSSSKGDEVYLSQAVGGVLTGYRAQVSFGAAANGVSFGRHRRSDGQVDFVAQSARTFGVDSPATVAQFRTGAGKTNAYPRVGPVVLSEIMYHPPDLGLLDNTRDEFIELKNITGAPVNLFDAAYPSNRWRLRGGVDFDFPSNTTLAANGTLVVVSFNPTNTTLLNEFKTAYGVTSAVTILGPWSGQLANASEEIELRRPDVPQQPPAADAGFVPYIVVERVVYADLPPWPAVADGSGWSLQRVSNTGYGNDATNWVGAAPSLNIATGTGDTDGDGMPDAYESQFPLALSPFNPNDGALDYDGDGMTSYQEYLAGTNPQSAASVLRVNGTFESPGRIRLQFSAVSNVTYNFQSRVSLSTGVWLNLANVPSAPSNRVITITNTATPMKFYRVVVP